MRIAVIGAGIAGLGCAWALSRVHDVTLFEKEPRLGGHSRTIEVPSNSSSVPVDTGFIVFNLPNYPNLVALFEHLAVPFVKSSMSFGVSQGGGKFEYGTGSIRSFLGQLSNLFCLRFWRMFLDILRFNRAAWTTLNERAQENMTLGQLLDAMRMGDDFRSRYLLPMASSIWSTPKERMLDYPARTFLRFFENHGLLTLFNQPQWYTVDGGSREYVSRLMDDYRGQLRLSANVSRVDRYPDGQTITSSEGKEEFDAVVFACHADQALELLTDADQKEQRILGAFSFQKNRVVTHKDPSFMPKRRVCWSSWVYRDTGRDQNNVCLSYWMNNLQPLTTDEPIVVTLNPEEDPASDVVEDDWLTEHPVFDQAAIDAQSRLEDIQGYRNTYYCGAWTGYGFHEDGLRSGLVVAEKLGAQIPWTEQRART